MTQPLREHFEVETDAGTTLRTFDYIDALEKYIAEQLKQERNKAIDEAIEEIVRLNDDGVLYEHTAKKVLESLKH